MTAYLDSAAAAAGNSCRALRGGLLFACLFVAGCGNQEDMVETGTAGATAPEGGVGADGEPLRAVVRITKESENRGRFETAIVEYSRADGVQMDLIAVVHIGDAGYYAQLEEVFRDYDSLLYEMIQPEGADPTQRGGGGSPVSMIQKGMCRALGLAFQLDSIDYGAPNFVHADLTTSGFAERWEARNESVWKMLMRAMSAGGFTTEGDLTPAQLLQIVRSPDRKARMKLLFADVFAEADDMLGGMAAPDEEGRDHSMLIGERNIAALDIMKREIEAGKKRLALFYGAGHLTDFDVRLRKDHGFKRGGVRWLTAWDIAPPPPKDEPAEDGGR